MALKRYRRQVINVHDANYNLPEVILSTGDEAGRIIQLAIIGGESSGTHCRFWLQKDDDTNVFQDMEQITAQYPTWEAAIHTGGLEPGTYPCMFRIGDDDGSVTETFRTTARVLQGMLIDAEESEEMQSQLSEFEQRTQDAIDANQAATAEATDAATAATDAATSASDAATAATTATTNANTATTNANAATIAANEAAESATDAATAANNAAEDATDAATEARDAAAAALASVGNIVLGEISMLDGSIETVDDAYVSPIRGIEVEGKSTQVSLSGKNLVNPQNVITGYIKGDGTIGNSAYDRIVYAKVEEGQTYTITGTQDRIPGATDDNWYVAFMPDVPVVGMQGQSNGVTTTQSISKTVTVPQGYSYIAIKFAHVQRSNTENTLATIQVEEGSTATEYEPWTGGIPSPSPDYPQAIHSVAEAAAMVAGNQIWQPNMQYTTTPLIPEGTEPLRSLPDGTHDDLIVRSDGSREIVRRVGSTMQAVTDGVTGTVGTDVLSYTGAIVDGVEVVYKLAEATTETLPAITMPSAPSADVTAWLDSKDESSAPIATDSSVSYERSMQIVIDRLEQAVADL